MTPEKYLESNKNRIIKNGLKNGFSENDIAEIVQRLSEYVSRYRKVRNSLESSDEITGELIEKSKFIFQLCAKDESSKYDFIMFWLTKILWNDPTFSFAKVGLAKYQNRNSGTVLFDFSKNFISEDELLTLLDVEALAAKELPRKYIIESDKLMSQIFELMKEGIECNYLQFREAIEGGSFEKLTIKKKNLTQCFVYLLSFIQGVDWYSDVCKSMNWTKSICSKQREKYDANSNVEKLIELTKTIHK